MRKSIFLSAVLFLIAVTFAACSDTVEDSLPVPVQEEENVIEDNPFAINIDEAEKTLEEILAHDYESTTKGGGISQIKRIKSRYTIGGESNVTRAASGEEVIAEHPRVHVFNFDDNGGFAIMGADKRGAPMLALTEKGELTPDMTIDNPGVAAALAHAEAVYAQMIVEAGSDTAYASNGLFTVAVVKDSVTVNKHGQCPVNWGQKFPYNQFCPPYYSGEHNYPTGCVTTAVAQLMAIHKYPASYGSCVFDWDEMVIDSTNVGIGLLMQLLGNSDNLDIEYGAGGSSGTIADVPQTLHNFGYTHPGEYGDYNVNTIISNIMIGLPVIIRGEGAAYTIPAPNNPNVSPSVDASGHAWLGDGCAVIRVTTHIYNHVTGQYTVQGPVVSQYVHCNFGWSGKGNGLFLSGYYNTNDSHYRPDNSNPFAGGYAYEFNLNTDMKMVTGIAK
jgi:hypothetical protein